MRLACAAVLLAPVVAGCLAHADEPAAADLVLVGGRVWTGDESNPWAEAVAIAGASLLAVGTEAEARRHVGPATRVVGLGGAFVSPGWRDNHAHVLQTIEGLSPDAARAALVPAPFVETDAEAEVRHEQDFAMQLAYHGSRSADAAVDEDGANLGPLSLYEACGPPLAGEGALAAPTEADLAAVMAAEDELARQGLTTVVEAQLRNMTNVAAVLELQERGLSKVRWQLRVVPGCYPYLDTLGLTPGSDGAWVRLLGVKLYADGYLGGWIAALRQPYSDRPGWTGVRTYDADTFLYRVEEAKARGLTVGTHAIGDASAAQALDAYEAAGVSAGDRFTIEHAQVLDRALIGRMADDGVVASIQPSFATTDQHFALSRLGPERLATSYVWHDLAQAGVVLASGSDYPIEVVTPAWGLQRIVTRAELDGSAPWFPEQALTVEQELRAMTWGQAYASKEEASRGVLKEGFAADLTVTREDPFAIPADQLASLTVVMTVANGQVTFEGAQSYPPPRPWQ